ncbi:MAG TPA: glycosyltransferase family 39 protein [Acidimicrobiales bacterium]|nr:glycosyltransferase family 39 protein [Acidimicrobiales bacterium]
MTATVAPAALPGTPDAAPVVLPPATPARARRFALLVAAAVIAGLALRIGIALTDDAPSTDETAYLRSGIALVEGDGFTRGGRPELHFPPFVPFLLGASDRVLGDPHTGTVVLTCLASAALVVPLALLARRLAGERAGITTAWVAALAPGLSTTLVNRGAGSEAEYLLLVVSAVWCVVSAAGHAGRGRWLRVAGAGLLVGLAYLTRPEGLFLGVPLGLAVLVLGARAAAAAGGGRRARLLGAGRLAAAFTVPVLLCIVPYASYLHDHTGTWQLSAKTQDASIDAWHAVAKAHREDRDSILWALDESGLRFSTERTSLPALARDDPSGYAAIVRTNVGALADQIAGPETNQVLAWLLLPLPVWLLAGVGAWRYRRSRLAWVMLAVGLLPVATALAFFVQPRYLVVAVALATVFVGAGLAGLGDRWRRPALAVALAFLALSTAQGFRSEAAGWWHPSDSSDQRAAGEWIAANTGPDDRVMTRSMVVEYYAEREAMAIPYAELDAILNYGRHYGAQYLVVDWYTAVRLRPQLGPLFEVDAVPGLRLVHELRAEGRGARIFALDPAPPRGRPTGPSLGFVGDG